MTRGGSDATSPTCAGVVLVVWLLSHAQLPGTPWTVAVQAPLSFTISWSLLKLTSTAKCWKNVALFSCYVIDLLGSEVMFSEAGPEGAKGIWKVVRKVDTAAWSFAQKLGSK